MKTSVLIEKLQKELEEHGDLEVSVQACPHFSDGSDDGMGVEDVWSSINSIWLETN